MELDFARFQTFPRGAFPGEQNLNAFLASLRAPFLKSWIPLKFYMKNSFHAYYFIKVAVRPKKVHDFSSLMTFYGYKVCQSHSKSKFQINLSVLKWFKTPQSLA